MRRVLMILMGAMLTGCTGMSSQFQCNVPAGGLCASMHQVDGLVRRGELPGLETQAPSASYIVAEDGK